jgi:hypothetical protein
LSGADCDTIIWWLQTLGERLAASKRGAQKSDMERFHLKKLNDVKVEYWVKISNRFVDLENLMMMTTTTTT